MQYDETYHSDMKDDILRQIHAIKHEDSTARDIFVNVAILYLTVFWNKKEHVNHQKTINNDKNLQASYE